MVTAPSVEGRIFILEGRLFDVHFGDFNITGLAFVNGSLICTPGNSACATNQTDISRWTNDTVSLSPRMPFPQNIRAPSGNVSALNVMPESNNSGNLGTENRRWNRLVVENANISNLGGLSPITLSNNIVGFNFNISADNFIGLGTFSNVTIEQNLTVLGSVRVRGKENMTVAGLNVCLSDGSFCETNGSSQAWNKTVNATFDVLFPNSVNVRVGIGIKNPVGVFQVVGESLSQLVNSTNDTSVMAFYRFENNDTVVFLDAGPFNNFMVIEGGVIFGPSKAQNNTGQLSGFFNGIDTSGRKPVSIINQSLEFTNNTSSMNPR